MRILEINKFYNAKRGADKHFLDVSALLEKGGQQVAEFSMWQKDDAVSVWREYFLSPVGYSNAFSIWQQIRGIFRMFYSFEAKKKINELLDEFKPDIVHIHNIYHQMSPAILFEIKKRNIPIVMTVHDFKLINPNHSLRLGGKPYRRCANGKYYQCFLDKCVKNSYAKSFLAALEMYWHAWLGTYEKNIDLYLAPSQFVKSLLIEWGMKEEKIIVLPHFISSSVNKSLKHYSFSVADSYAIYPGKISREKGVETLLEIFRNIKGMKLYLAGEIEKGFAIPLDSNIVYLGFLESDQLQGYLRNAKCVVSGSQLPETFGLIALEAIQNGKPFVGFNAGAYGEVVEDGVDGFIVEDKEEFVQVIEKIAREEKTFDSEVIKAHADKFNERQYLEKLKNIFSDLIEKAKID